MLPPNTPEVIRGSLTRMLKSSDSEQRIVAQEAVRFIASRLGEEEVSLLKALEKHLQKVALSSRDLMWEVRQAIASITCAMCGKRRTPKDSEWITKEGTPTLIFCSTKCYAKFALTDSTIEGSGGWGAP